MPQTHQAPPQGSTPATAAPSVESSLRPLATQSALDRATSSLVLRVHFHAFMLSVHQRVHEWKRGLPSLAPGMQAAVAGRGGYPPASSRAAALAPERDALEHVAHAIADDVAVLCFDEFQVRACVEPCMRSTERVGVSVVCAPCVFVFA